MKASDRLAEGSAVCPVYVSNSVRPISDAAEEFLKMLRDPEINDGMTTWKACSGSI